LEGLQKKVSAANPHRRTMITPGQRNTRETRGGWGEAASDASIAEESRKASKIKKSNDDYQEADRDEGGKSRKPRGRKTADVAKKESWPKATPAKHSGGKGVIGDDRQNDGRNDSFVTQLLRTKPHLAAKKKKIKPKGQGEEILRSGSEERWGSREKGE